jgi:hypothetical protein
MTRPRSHRVPREVLDLFAADDGRGAWTIREHARRPIPDRKSNSQPVSLIPNAEAAAPIREPSPWRLRWHRMRPIAESIAVTLLQAAVVFIVTLVTLCLGGRSSAAFRPHMRLRAPRRHRQR